MTSWTEVDGVSHEPGLLYVSTPTSGAATGANTTKTTLIGPYALKAGQVSHDGALIEIEVSGTTAGNGNTKTIAVEVGALSFALNQVTTAPNGKTWHMRMQIIRNSANTGVWRKQARVSTTNETDVLTLSTVNIDWTAANAIVLVGTNGTASAGDITGHSLTVEYKP